ncbi:phosphatase PAP2 family protein [Nonomuraea sp. NPDC049421]|uniref:phosphatase PAP2 family protein n=1 Tax=Nonomuraea sp. NPDC049421 TaxID=3155275 RepID=UPI003443E304
MDFLDDLHRAELGPIAWLQGWPDVARPVMELVSVFGTNTFFLLVLPVLYWCVNPALALRLGFTVMVAAGTNAIGKLALHQPRPYWIDPGIRAFSVEESFGLPSGHAQVGTAGMGRFAVAVGRPWAWWAAVVTMALVCLSRVYLGVHFISDVVVGVALGVVVLVVVLRVERPATLWWRRQALWVQLCASVAASGVLLAVAALASAPYGDWAVPAGWSAAGMVDPESLDTVVVMAGVLLGTLAGTSVMYRIGWFDAGGPLGLRAARWVLGTVVAVAIWYAEREVLPESGLSTFVAFAVLALWVQLGAPVLFIRLGLMEPAATAGPAVSAGARSGGGGGHGRGH